MAKTSGNGEWDQEPLGSGRVVSMVPKQTKQTAKAKVVRDDWDDDEDDDDDGEPEQGTYTRANPSGNKTSSATPSSEQNGNEESSRIWEEANKRAPMPELIVARASTSASVAPPPPAALQPTLRILKRPPPSTSASPVGAVTPASSSPSSGPSSASGGTSPAPRGTLAEREAQYQEARSRIFGEKEKSGGVSPGLVSRTSSSSGGVVTVVRDPLGPELGGLDSGGQEKVHGPDRPAKGFGERRRGKK